MSILTRGASRASGILYEHVLTKNFQIIETFLAQFNEIFQKQDQLQLKMEKFQQRLIHTERDTKETFNLITKSNEIFDRKISSLKEIIIEKLMGSGLENSHAASKVVTVVRDSSIDQVASTISEYQKKEASKLEQGFKQQLGRFEIELEKVLQRTNYLTSITTSIQSKLSHITDEKTNYCTAAMKEEESLRKQKMERKIDDIEKIFKVTSSEMEREIKEISSKLAKLQKVDAEIVNLKNEIASKTAISMFESFQSQYKNDQVQMIKEINQTFARKKETKNSLRVLEKKLEKFQNSQPNQKEEEEKSYSTQKGFMPKAKVYSSIHRLKKQKMSSECLNKSMNVRKISHHKFLNIQKYI